MLKRSPAPAFKPCTRSTCPKQQFFFLRVADQRCLYGNDNLIAQVVEHEVKHSGLSPVGVAYCHSSTGQVKSIS